MRINFPNEVSLACSIIILTSFHDIDQAVVCELRNGVGQIAECPVEREMLDNYISLWEEQLFYSCFYSQMGWKLSWFCYLFSVVLPLSHSELEVVPITGAQDMTCMQHNPWKWVYYLICTLSAGWSYSTTCFGPNIQPLLTPNLEVWMHTTTAFPCTNVHLIPGQSCSHWCQWQNHHWLEWEYLVSCAYTTTCS